MAKLDHAPDNFRGVKPEAIKQAWEAKGFNPTLTPIPATKSPVKPDKGLLNGFVYTPAAKTNVRETWIRFGWKPINDNY